MDRAVQRYTLLTGDELTAEVAASALWTAGALGLWERTAADGIELVAYFPERTSAVPEGGRWEVEEPADWLATWRAGLEPVRVGSLLVTPSWHEAASEPRAIRIDPQMAFGTGQHATTRLCLRAIEESVTHGDRVLDVGTGTGLLAIAAVRLGAARAVAVDIDPDAVEVARRNILANLGEPDRVHVWAGSVPADDGAFDLVVANLTTATVVELAGALVRAARPGGRIIASGIAEERTDVAVDALRRQGVRDVRVRDEEGWILVSVERGAGALPS